MTENLLTNKSVGIRDGLILDTMRRLVSGTRGDEIDAVAHAALSYCVLAKLVGVDDLADLINQIEEDVNRIIDVIKDVRREDEGQ
jgi:hypothetical protein